jgi:copper transport protein
MRSPLRRALTLVAGAGPLVLICLVGLVARAAPADAHAELVSTTPAAGSQLDASPDQVLLEFTESVSAGDDAIEVLTSDGDRLDVGSPEHPDGHGAQVAVDLPALEDGSYVVAWRVVSSDSHPISGAFTFGVGVAPAGGANADAEAVLDDVLAGSGADRSLGAAYGVVRFVAFAGVVLLVGGAMFVALLWPAGADDRRARGLLAGGWWLTLAATALTIPLHAAYSAGGSLADTFDSSLLGDELGLRTGRTWVVRLLLLAVIAAVGRVLLARVTRAGRAQSGDAGDAGDDTPAERPDVLAWGGAPGELVALGALGLALLATVTLTGHAVSGDVIPIAAVTDLVHLAAVSVWLGGLALMFGAVLRLRPERGDDVERVAATFSEVAFAAVLVIVASGVVQAVRQVGSWAALTDTTYGRLLLVKVGLFVALLAAAAASRAWVRRRAAARVATLALSPGPGAAAASAEVGRTRLALLRQSVGVEVVLAIAVLAVTALLVNAVPGASAGSGAAGGEPFSTTVHGALTAVEISVDPAAVGPADVEIAVTDHAGSVFEPEEVTASLTLPERDLGPLDVPLTATGPGTYAAEDTEIPFAGTWLLEVDVRTSDIDQDQLAVDVPVAPVP